jgi:predicted enzyme related to lactoylglutathione lyase
MFKITGMRSWNLNADDLGAMVAFYEEGLGATETGRQNIAGAEVVRLRLGEHGIGLFDGSQGPRPGVPHHTFTCEGPADPEALTKELGERGIKVDSLRRQGEGPGYSLYVLDPSGNRIELSVMPQSK